MAPAPRFLLFRATPTVVPGSKQGSLNSRRCAGKPILRSLPTCMNHRRLRQSPRSWIGFRFRHFSVGRPTSWPLRDEAGNRLTHSDSIEGLVGAGFKLEEVAEVPPQEKEPEKTTEPEKEPEPSPEPEPEPEKGADEAGTPDKTEPESP